MTFMDRAWLRLARFLLRKTEQRIYRLGMQSQEAYAQRDELKSIIASMERLS